MFLIFVIASNPSLAICIAFTRFHVLIESDFDRENILYIPTIHITIISIIMRASTILVAFLLDFIVLLSYKKIKVKNIFYCIKIVRYSK